MREARALAEFLCVIVLGLAVATSEHHAAALVVDGRVVGAAEEERFNGVKHYGWHPPGRPGANLCNDGDLRLDDAIARGAVAWLLAEAGIAWDDVDRIAVNGIPWRLHGAREPVREGRIVWVPHHLAHAALAARTSPWERCHVLTVDGRGEYETAAWFTFRDGRITRRAELPAGEGRSIGGAYETVTRVIGLGTHGQGETMALASFARGDASHLAEAFRIGGFSDFTLDESRLQRIAEARVRPGDDPLAPAGRDLAADVQAATEEAVLALARDGVAEDPSAPWALAGGVALNCRANSVLRDALGAEVWVPSAAHDAGTALGAALEVAWLEGEPPPGAVRTAGLGPAVDRAEAEAALRDQGLSTVASGDVLGAAVDRLVSGRVLGWCVGRLEYGPRALGQRSLVAHPGHPGVQDRMNRIKARQAWRPFGPSVLAEHRESWFRDPGFGPFMTFTADVLPERRGEVSGIVHVDGTTRPQSVDDAAEPAWRELIRRFHEATGVPMLLNTSFNGKGEPIVRGAKEAVASAIRLGLDGLVVGDLLVDLPGSRG